MGEVYRAHDTRLDRDVALKVLTAQLSDAPGARERFQREARAVAALSHPNICTIHDVGVAADGHTFLVMELLQGETVQQRLQRGPLDIDGVFETGIALADALASAHAAGIVHRDIKPANIILTERGPKILDFGVAKAGLLPDVDPSADTTMTQGPLLTEPGSAVGTVAYMSPEQLRGEPLDARSDLFSFGLVLYEMATGRRAFSGATSAVVGAAILHEHPPPPRELRPAVPERFGDIVLKCMEKDRALRYQRASDIHTDLQRLKRDLQSGADTSVAPARKRPFTRWAIAGLSVATALVIAAGGYLTYRRTPTLTDTDTVVLADIVNRTGDPIFDDTLRHGLAVQLEQSPFLSLLSEERIRNTLLMMKQRPDARLTPDIAQDVCVRTASTAVLDGSIASLGSQYVLSLRARVCSTGDILDDEQVQAARKEDVLAAIGQLATGFRTRAGESLATVRKYSMRLEETTTPSLEALQAYTVGVQAAMTTASPTATSLFKRAIELDPDFAMAHARLGIGYSVLGESALAREHTLKAYRLRSRANDRERFFIDTMYDRQVTGNMQREQQTLESWMQTYPRDAYPLGLLGGFATTSTGNYELSVEVSDKAIALDPALSPPYASKARSYLHLGRFADAEAALKQANDRGLAYPTFLFTPYMIAIARDDPAAMTRATVEARRQPGARAIEDSLLHLEALWLARSGRLQEAVRTARTAVEVAKAAGQAERAAMFDAALAIWQAFYGNTSAARQSAEESLRLGRGRDVDYAAAFALSVAGDRQRARALADDLARDFPEDTSVQMKYLPTLRALFALSAAQPAAAIQELQSSSRFDLALGGLGFNAHVGALHQVYVRGTAYLTGHQAVQAAAEFQKILDHRTLVLADPVDAMARLQLARALTEAGDTVKAKAAYEDLLRLWKDADADMPLLKRAQAEYASLR